MYFGPVALYYLTIKLANLKRFLYVFFTELSKPSPLHLFDPSHFYVYYTQYEKRSIYRMHCLYRQFSSL